jgi:hypothetical protein
MNIESLRSSCNDIMQIPLGKITSKNKEAIKEKSFSYSNTNKSTSISFDDDPAYQSLRADIQKIKNKITQLENNLSKYKTYLIKFSPN